MAKTNPASWRTGCVVDLALDGLSSRVYAAYYGKWRNISEVYSDLYCANSPEKKGNTGRISHTTKALAGAGYIVAKSEGPGWCKWTATLLPIYLECHRKGVELSDAERGMLEEMLQCEGKTSASPVPLGFAGKNFGLTREEARGKEEFLPTPIKLKQFLHALAELSIMFVGNRQSQMTRGASDELLEAVKAALSGGQGKNTPESKAIETSTLSQIALRLAMISRTQLSNHELPEKVFLFKLLRLLHDAETAEEIENQVMAAYE